MQNRNLIWIAVIAVTLIGAAIHFHSPKRAGELHQPAIADFKNAHEKRKPISVPNFQTINSSTNNPEEQTLAQLRDIIAQDPTDQNGRAANLLNDLCGNGQFETALKTIDIIPADLRSDWLKIIFNRWAQSDPQEAMKSLDTIQDPGERAGAFQAAIAGWNSHDPATLADYAVHLDASDNRDYALALALNNWSLQDPTALATWLNTLPRGGEFDCGAALMIAKTDSANRTPELAMKWVENIDDPTLKQNSFARVLTQWLQTDSAAAKQYITTATWLDDSARSKILAALPPP